MKKNSKLIVMLLSGLMLRLGLGFFGTLELDHFTFVSWSHRLTAEGFGNFYSGWSDYLPGYLYVLWFFGKLDITFWGELVYKLPAIIADILTGLLIYKIVSGKNEKTALYASAIYVFNPAVLANSTLWGQVDALVALFAMLAVYLLSVDKLAFSALTLALGTLVKPQAAFAAPVIFWLLLQKKNIVRKLLVYAFLGACIFFAAFIPFAQGNVLEFAIKRSLTSLTQYPYTSVNAFNFWAIFGMWTSDTQGFVSLRSLGFVLAFVFYFLAYLRMRTIKLDQTFKPYFLLVAGMLATFLFLTRMHERHMLPVFAPLALLGVFSLPSLITYITLSLVYMLNLYYAYVWIEQDFFQVIGPDMVKIVSGFVVFVFIYWLAAFNQKYKMAIKRKVNLGGMETKIQFIKIKLPISSKTALILVLAFSLISRVYMLHLPQNEYFDEVYHAFTARAMLNGDPKAWEWWNENPEGYAYEWTHPPLAKLGMVAGMSIFGENALGWRLPAALLGVGASCLIYLITKHLADDQWAGVFAAMAFNLDGLALVMSRIGMNDMYLLFFVLLSFYLFLREKYMPSALALGLAAASKWSFVWFLPILGVSFLALRRKFTLSLAFYFILPPLVYVASYLPMFTSGHGWDIFIGVQKQMWWYHTGLDATHAYTSPWWSWPLLKRPIWLYTSGNMDRVRNIYAMGNPLIFWTGILSVIYTAYLAILCKSKKLGLIIFSYFVFFVTWAASPRIMFLYHYLPSVAFMTMTMGISLRKHPKLALLIFPLALVLFIYFYPHWTGIVIPSWLNDSYYWFGSWM